MKPSVPRRLLPTLLALVIATLSGCRTVEFYEMQAFSDPVMTMGRGRAHVHMRQKCLYSTEGAAGGIGTSSGGGCGCY